MSYNETIFLPHLGQLWSCLQRLGAGKRVRIRPTDECKFLKLLNSDVRFQIYDHLAPDRHARQIVDIFQPKDNSGKDLGALMSTNREIHNDILLWLTQNPSWLTRKGPRGNAIQLRPTTENTKYLLKWTREFGRSYEPSKAVEAWHRFCFHNSTESPIGPLVIEFHLSNKQDALSAFERLFAEPYRIEMGKRRAAAGPLPIAPYLTSIEIVLCLDTLAENNQRCCWICSRRRCRARLDWNQKLSDAWTVMWHEIGPCSGVVWRRQRKCRPRHPELSWSVSNA